MIESKIKSFFTKLISSIFGSESDFKKYIL